MKSSITKLGALSKHSNKKKRQLQGCKMTLLRSSANPLLTNTFLCCKTHPAASHKRERKRKTIDPEKSLYDNGAGI